MFSLSLRNVFLLWNVLLACFERSDFVSSALFFYLPFLISPLVSPNFLYIIHVLNIRSTRYWLFIRYLNQKNTKIFISLSVLIVQFVKTCNFIWLFVDRYDISFLKGIKIWYSQVNKGTGISISVFFNDLILFDNGSHTI